MNEVYVREFPREGGQRYDVTPDGQRFVVVETLGDADAGQAIHVVQNWHEEFRGREQD